MSTKASSAVRERLAAYLNDLMDLEGLAPTPSPPEDQTLYESTYGHLSDAAQKGDNQMVKFWRDRLQDPEKMFQRVTTDDILAPARSSVEAAILSSERFQQSEMPVVLLSEWPTSNLNADTFYHEGGYLVLLHAGFNVLVHHYLALALRQRRLPQLREDNTLVDAIVLDLRGGDLMAFPALTIGDMSLIKLGIHQRAVREFVVAHEYAHILLGHFSDAPSAEPPVAGLDPRNQVLHVSWKQEFDADDLAFELMVDPILHSDSMRKTVDGAARQEHTDPQLMLEAARIQATVAAPVMFFTLAYIYEEGARRLRGLSQDSYYESHPDAYERRRIYVERVLSAKPSSHLVASWDDAEDLDDLVDNILVRLAGPTV